MKKLCVGTFRLGSAFCWHTCHKHEPSPEATMHGIIYLVGLIVVILAILSFFGLR